MNDELSLIQSPVREELETFNSMLREALDHDNPLLKIALNHLVQRRGKQMRPILTLLSAKAKGAVSEGVLHAALALELLHTASLVHDDVVDESDRRRGQKSVNTLLDNKAAVLIGDYILSKALQHASMTGDVRIVEMVSVLGQTLADGELLQLDNISGRDFSESSYYEVVRKKTASLFSVCAEAGAVLSSGDEGFRYVMKRLGMLIGMCFQLRDDIMDIDSSTDIGKPVGNDLREGKLTLPVLYVCQKNACAAELAILVREGRAGREEIDRLIEMTKSEGGIAFAESAMAELSGLASGLLDEIQNRSVAQALQAYINYVSDRKI